MADHLCKDNQQTAHDAEKADARQAEGKAYFVCRKCRRRSHKAAHLCKPEKVKAKEQ